MSQANAEARSWQPGDDAAWLGWPERAIQPLLAVDVTLYGIAASCDELVTARLLGSPEVPRRTRLFLANESSPGWTLGAALRDGLIETLELGEAIPPDLDPTEIECAPARLLRGALQLQLMHAGETVGCLEISGLPDVHPQIPMEEWSFLSALAGAALSRQRHRVRVERSQVALASTTHYLDRLLGLVSDGLIVLDVEGQVLALNSTAQEIVGAGIEAVGRPLEERLSSSCASAVLALVQLAARQASPVTRTIQWRLAGEGTPETRAIEISVERVQSDPEAAAGLLVRLRDLEGMGEQAWFQRGEEIRTAQMNALADSLSRPMSAMRAYLSLLREEIPGTGRPAELWTSLDLQAEWLQSRLDTLVVLDHFRFQQPTWRDLPVDPSVLLDRALGRVRTRLEMRGVSFEFAPTDAPLRARVDVEKFVLVLSHLLDELAHLLDGPGCITAELRHRRSPTSRVQLTLRAVSTATPGSNGSGHLEYSRLAEAAGVEDTRSLYALPLARTVVHRYGGTLLWDRPENGVAAITLTLPCDPEEARN